MNELVLKRLQKMRQEDRKALIDAAQDIIKGSQNSVAEALARKVLALAGVS